MKHPLLASTAAIAALFVCVGGLGGIGGIGGFSGFGGPWVSAGAMSVVVVAIALGWPQLLGAPARKSLSTVIGLTGLVAVWATALWPGPEPGEGQNEFGASLIEPIAVSAALGTVAAFIVQLFRGSGSPHRLESTAGTVTGVAVVGAGAGWVALARFDAGPLAVSVAASLALAALACSVPLPRPVGALLAVVLAGVVPFILSVLWPVAWPALPLPAAVVSGVLGVLVVVLTGRAAPDRGSGRPVGTRAAISLGVAPVAIVGLVTYFVFRILPV